MKHRATARPRRPITGPVSLRALAILLAVYLCAPFIASVPQIGQADWAGVDWGGTWSAVGVSAASASVAALVILAGGVPLGYWLARSNSRALAALGFIVQLPLALPPLTSGVLLLFLLGPYSPLGEWTDGALTDSFAGIVFAETFVAAPFLIVAARSAFAALDPVYDDVAATLGHRAASRFFRVALPAAWPSIRAGLALAWLRAFGEFGATVMVAYHPYSLPVYTYVLFGSQGLPAMMPLLLPTLAIAIVCAALSVYSVRNSRAAITPPENGDDAAARTVTPAAPAAVAKQTPSDDALLAFDLHRQVGTFRLDVAWRPASRRLAIVGPSGSGKSLALRLIAGLEPNDAGFVRLGAAELGALPPERRQIGYMPQDYALFPHMSVARQIAFPVDADAASARYWIDHLGLAELTARLPRELSFGQRQRVALARALSRHSHLLLFDEPFSALDTPRRRRLQQALRALQREIPAVTVIVTHEPDEAALLADEVLVVEHGRVLHAGSVDEVFARPASPRVAELLGLDNVGAGVMLASREIETASGLRLACADDAGIATGARAMWRVKPDAIRFAPDAAYPATVAGEMLRYGERYAMVDICGQSFAVPAHAVKTDASTLHATIDPAGVTAWAAPG